MKNRYVKTVLPSWGAVLASLVLPLILSIYFIVTKYSEKFVATTEINYFDVQNNILATVFLEQAWNDWLARVMDFAFWGVLASLAILIWWGVSVAKTSVENHNIQSGFSNFQASKEKWHGNFVVVAAVKIVLVFVMAYSIFSLIARAIPQLATGIANCLQTLNPSHLQQAVVGALMITGLQLLFVTVFKLFKITRAE